MQAVQTVAPYILGALLVAILAVLVFGVAAMGSKRATPAFRNKLMRVRVGLHALAVLILLLLLATTIWTPGQ